MVDFSFNWISEHLGASTMYLILTLADGWDTLRRHRSATVVSISWQRDPIRLMFTLEDYERSERTLSSPSTKSCRLFFTQIKKFWPRMQAEREARWRIDPESYLIPGCFSLRHLFHHYGFIAHIQNNGFAVFQASHHIMHGTAVNKVLGTGTQAMYALTKATETTQ